MLANILVIFAVGILAGIFIGANDGSVAGPLGTIAILLILAMLIYGLAVVLPFTAIQARRLRDAGYHWAFIFFRFAVGIGGIVLLILFCQPTQRVGFSDVKKLYVNVAHFNISDIILSETNQH